MYRVSITILLLHSAQFIVNKSPSDFLDTLSSITSSIVNPDGLIKVPLNYPFPLFLLLFFIIFS